MRKNQEDNVRVLASKRVLAMSVAALGVMGVVNVGGSSTAGADEQPDPIPALTIEPGLI
jgi:hypothetical protein